MYVVSQAYQGVVSRQTFLVTGQPRTAESSAVSARTVSGSKVLDIRTFLGAFSFQRESPDYSSQFSLTIAKRSEQLPRVYTRRRFLSYWRALIVLDFVSTIVWSCKWYRYLTVPRTVGVSARHMSQDVRGYTEAFYNRSFCDGALTSSFGCILYAHILMQDRIMPATSCRRHCHARTPRFCRAIEQKSRHDPINHSCRHWRQQFTRDLRITSGPRFSQSPVPPYPLYPVDLAEECLP